MYSNRSNSREQRMEGGYSYTRSYRSFNQQLPLPMDADVDGLIRSDGEGVVGIKIPRKR
ncbi:MAG: Hsp20 family protein [Gammaproteobacteria bacterium]|nr:Hsp20 family protein [Gammaproteobacteria bacterium]